VLNWGWSPNSSFALTDQALQCLPALSNTVSVKWDRTMKGRRATIVRNFGNIRSNLIQYLLCSRDTWSLRTEENELLSCSDPSLTLKKLSDFSDHFFVDML